MDRNELAAGGAAGLPRNPTVMDKLARFDLYSAGTMLLSTLVVLLIVGPLVLLVLQSIFSGGRIDASAFTSLLQKDTLDAVVNTLTVVLVSSAFAVAVGSLFAWISERSDAHLGVAGALMPIIPLLVPNTALAIGWVFIGEPRVGFLNGLISVIVGHHTAPFNIYTWWGLIWVYTIQGTPYVYLVVSSALRNTDSSLEEASLMSGAGILRTIWKVSLPSVAAAITAAAFLAIITSLGNYSVPAILGTAANITIVPVRMVRLLTSFYPPRMVEAQMLGTLTVVIVAVLWLAQRWVSKNVQFVALSGRSSTPARIRLGRWKTPARVAMVSYIICASALPLIALLLVALQPFWSPTIDVKTWSLNNFRAVLFENDLTISALRNSLMYSTVGATLAIAVAVVVAIYANIRTNVLGTIVEAILKLPAVVPNLVTTLALLITFSGAPFYLSGTPFLLVLAFIVIYIPPGSIVANSAVSQIGKDLREASYISGALEGRMIRTVVVPLAIPGIVAGWCIVFVHMVGDLSASTLLSGVNTPTIGFVTLSIWENGSFGTLAALSVLICIVVTTVVSTSFVISRRYQSKWR